MKAIQPQTVPLEADADGVIRVAGARVTLETLVACFERGESAEEMASAFDLPLADVYAVVAYYLRNRDEVERYLEDVQQTAAQRRDEAEAASGSKDFRDRLRRRAGR